MARTLRKQDHSVRFHVSGNNFFSFPHEAKRYAKEYPAYIANEATFGYNQIYARSLCPEGRWAGKLRKTGGLIDYNFER